MHIRFVDGADKVTHETKVAFGTGGAAGLPPVTDDRREQLPPWLWQKVGLATGGMPAEVPEFEKRRIDLLDRRPWFGPERARLEPAA